MDRRQTLATGTTLEKLRSQYLETEARLANSRAWEPITPESSGYEINRRSSAPK